MRERSLPLGIDIGTTRLRIAEVRAEGGATVLSGALAVDLEPQGQPAAVGAVVAASVRELGTRERRCILCVGEPDAVLRAVVFPPMSSRERDRAAAFEAGRLMNAREPDLAVRTAPIGAERGLYAVGVVRKAELDRRLAIARAAKLRPVAVDHEACALRRAFPLADAVLDVGARYARLYVFGQDAPAGVALAGGSEGFTNAISRSLGIDTIAAERRKRATGFAGAGEAELTAFAGSVGRGLLAARSQGVTDIQRIVMTGNGSRLAGLAARLERDTGCSVHVADGFAVSKSAYPHDILRAAAPDWALAAGLATWAARDAA